MRVNLKPSLQEGQLHVLLKETGSTQIKESRCLNIQKENTIKQVVCKSNFLVVVLEAEIGK